MTREPRPGGYNVYFGGKLIWNTPGLGSGSAVVTDRLGSVVYKDQNISSSLFPSCEEANTTHLNRPKFAACYRDGSTALDYAQQRYYASTLGRFTSSDPYWGSVRLGDSRSWNRYAYVQNDPVNYIDPTGLLACQGPMSRTWWNASRADRQTCQKMGGAVSVTLIRSLIRSLSPTPAVGARLSTTKWSPKPAEMADWPPRGMLSSPRGGLQRQSFWLLHTPDTLFISVTFGDQTFASAEAQITAGLTALGITEFTIDPSQSGGNHIVFTLPDPQAASDAVATLEAKNGAVLQGNMGTFHNKPVGTPNTDFRTITGQTGLFSHSSMQITLPTPGNDGVV